MRTGRPPACCILLLEGLPILGAPCTTRDDISQDATQCQQKRESSSQPIQSVAEQRATLPASFHMSCPKAYPQQRTLALEILSPTWLPWCG
jgi:hypothetical protein